MNRRSFFARMLGAACLAVAERVMPAAAVPVAIVSDPPRRETVISGSAILRCVIAPGCKIVPGAALCMDDEGRVRPMRGETDEAFFGFAMPHESGVAGMVDVHWRGQFTSDSIGSLREFQHYDGDWS